MKTPIIVSGLALAAGIAGSAQAAFTGFTVESMGTIGGRDVYRVYANFNAPTDVLLNVLKHRVTAGSMSGVLHNNAGSSGRWSPGATQTAAQEANDSFVTIDGLVGFDTSTVLDGSFTGGGIGSVIPEDAGWYNNAPETPLVVGSSGKMFIMQVAVAPGNAGYTASLQVGYKVSTVSTTALFGSGTYTIPAPGAIALLGAAGAMVSRRRRS